MKRFGLSLLLLFLPLAVWADGMVIPPMAFPANVTIPDQQALICYSNGVERLVIETRFTGSGTNFAWVVPLPSQPMIEPATTGLFPTLEYMFQPEIIHTVTHYYESILFIIIYVMLFRLANRFVSVGFLICMTLLLFCLSGVLLSAFVTAGISANFPVSNGVSILDRQIVGIYDTETISSKDPTALQNWLLENGYTVPANAQPVIADYVKSGWVFVAAKVRRDSGALDTSTPHPLSFTFKTDRPVYPMRLTGLNGHPLTVALYVFANSRFTAPHFQLESCTQPEIVHPLLSQWTTGLPIATKLTAKLSISDMQDDIWLEQSPYIFDQGEVYYSHQGALITAMNWGTACFALGFLGDWICNRANKIKQGRRLWYFGHMILFSVLITGLIYSCLPKINVRLVNRPWFNTGGQREAILEALSISEWTNAAQARAIIQNTISSSNFLGWTNWNNAYLGGTIHEEDSPGNFIFRETDDQFQLVFFDRSGFEDPRPDSVYPVQQTNTDSSK
jgi:Uncharacterized protein conserved in bacteria (DUF2330)